MCNLNVKYKLKNNNQIIKSNKTKKLMMKQNNQNKNMKIKKYNNKQIKNFIMMKR